jgi:hypothetical protein
MDCGDININNCEFEDRIVNSKRLPSCSGGGSEASLDAIPIRGMHHGYRDR